MSDAAKVTLSAGELAMANDKNIILTKQAIIDKTFLLFGGLVPTITETFQPIVAPHAALCNVVPKIFKGENYNGFPYVMMDYPACFEKHHIFAVRTMFWWGNFISITIQLSGRHKMYWEKNVLKKSASNPHLYVAVGNEEWQHHFEEDNYLLFSSLNAAQKNDLTTKTFIKIALKYKLHHWNMMQSILPIGYKEIANLLVD